MPASWKRIDGRSRERAVRAAVERGVVAELGVLAPREEQRRITQLRQGRCIGGTTRGSGRWKRAECSIIWEKIRTSESFAVDLSLMKRMGVSIDRFGDADSQLAGL